MRKTILTLAALAAVAVIAGCGKDAPSGAPSSATASVAASEPTADTEGEEPINGPSAPVADVTALKVVRSSKVSFPEGNVVRVVFNIKNSARYAVTFHVTIAIFDASGTQATAVGVGTDSYGPTLPGKTLHVSGDYGVQSELPAGDFTAQVTEVQRQPA